MCVCVCGGGGGGGGDTVRFGVSQHDLEDSVITQIKTGRPKKVTKIQIEITLSM